MPSRIRLLPKAIIFAALTLTCAATSAAQTPAGELGNVLIKRASFTADEFSALERGEAVVKLLPTTDKREVAFCGVVRLQGAPATLMAAFQKSLTQPSNGLILGGGRLGTPPAPGDLQSLTLDRREAEDMKRCAVGDCKLKMSAAMIERLRAEVDWAAPDYQLRAASLYRLMLSDYVRDYLARGDAALIDYDDRGPGAAPAAEAQRALLNSLPYVKDSAPEFAAYLLDFPRRELPGVENALHWSKIKFGFKPVIVITHTATYTRRRDDDTQILVATKQLYASHYLDSSLSLTLVTSVPAAGGSSDTCLLYANRAHTDTLDGLLGGLKRRIIESEVTNGLRAILQQTKLNAEARPANPPDAGLRADDEAASGLWSPRLLKMASYFFLALSVVASLLLLGLRKRDLKTHGP